MCKSASHAVLSRMQLAIHAIRRTPHGASRLVQAMSVKTRRAPSRHCRDPRVYGHTTTDMHDISSTLVKHPRGSYIVNPHCCLWKWPHHKLNQSIDAVIYMQEFLPVEWFLKGFSSPFTRFVQQLTALRAWCKQCLPGR